MQAHLLLVLFISSILFSQNFQVWIEIEIIWQLSPKSRQSKGTYKDSRKNEMDIWGFEV